MKKRYKTFVYPGIFSNALKHALLRCIFIKMARIFMRHIDYQCDNAMQKSKYPIFSNAYLI